MIQRDILKDGTREEKRVFLSMDMIERMIRVEQSVSASFHNYVPYNKTEYYQSLSSNEKRQFDRYLRMKKASKHAILVWASVFSVFIFLSLIGAPMMSGYVVNEGGSRDIAIGGWFIIGFIILVLLIISIRHRVYHRRKERKFGEYLKIIDGVFLRNHLRR